MNSSALATDGSGRAAHVAVEGGNKIKVKKGVALLKDVRVAADEVSLYRQNLQHALVAFVLLACCFQLRMVLYIQTVSRRFQYKSKKALTMVPALLPAHLQAGSYALRVQSASRKVAVGDAVLHLVMQPLNAVTDLRLVLPETLASGDCAAGTAAQLNVEVLTENGLPLPPEVAAGGLILKVMPPGGRSKAQGQHDCNCKV